MALAGQFNTESNSMFLSFHMGVAGLGAQPWMVRPTGNTPAIPDGTMHLTTNLLNLHIDINCVLLRKRFRLTLFLSFI